MGLAWLHRRCCGWYWKLDGLREDLYGLGNLEVEVLREVCIGFLEGMMFGGLW